MVARWQLVVLSAVAEAVALVLLFPDYSIRRSFGLSFAAILSLHILVLGLWTIVIYPKLFSPLRHLPQPSVSTFAQCAIGGTADRSLKNREAPSSMDNLAES